MADFEDLITLLATRVVENLIRSGVGASSVKIHGDEALQLADVQVELVDGGWEARVAAIGALGDVRLAFVDDVNIDYVLSESDAPREAGDDPDLAISITDRATY